MTFAAICGALLPAVGLAQTYPTKPIKLILPYNPGGIVDAVGRILAQQIGDVLGQPLIPENRPGAGGIVGTDVVARSLPDGYTLLLMDPAIVINPTLQEQVPYDLFKQLDTISVVSSSPLVLVVAPQLDVNTFADFVAYAKANPGKLNFASAGVGTTPHLAGELFKQRTGIEATHVPYKGIGASYTDMMTNKVQFAFSSIAGALPFTSGNKVLPLATTGQRRSPVYPDKPTIQEAGIKDFTVDLWLAAFTPAGVPADVRARLNEAIKSALHSPELKAAFANFGVESRGTSAEEGAAFVKADFEKWKKVIEDAKIKIN
ncbi:MAG: Bug family tripartite tricarboxylate transporter substrate binding protein [Xanthobacteraceae bacterium]